MKVLEYIKNNIENLSLIDPINSNNHLDDLMSFQDKLRIKSVASSTLNSVSSYDSSSYSWSKYFPKNQYSW